jgi:ATP-dependent helicase/nuclease subunit A
LFQTKYLNHKIKTGELRISDLEVVALALMRAHPDTAHLFSTDWDFWMLDEYQDTSPIQVELLHKLQGQAPSFTVGDPQQSIYLFRGARSEVFAAKEAELKQNGGKLDTLDKNYRSRPALVRFFNTLFADKKQFFPAVAAKPETNLDFADVRLMLRPKDDKSAKCVASEVQRLLKTGISANEICVLARTHKSLDIAAKELTTMSVPCLVHSASGFYVRREILDALSLLRFLLNPHDNVNLLELLRSPWFRIDDQKILELLSGKKNFSFWNEVKSLESFQTLNGFLLQREEHSICEIFRRALVDFGFFDFSNYLDVTGRREANLWKLVNDLEQAVRQPGFSFIDFSRQKVREISIETKEDQDAVSAKDSQRVNLMTVHQSKGLQFEHVILMDIDDASGGRNYSLWSFDEEKKRVSFPIYSKVLGRSVRTLGEIYCQNVRSQREREEAARLLYVALTRAVQSIVLIGSEFPKKNSLQVQMQFSGNGYTFAEDRGPWELLSDNKETEKVKGGKTPLNLGLGRLEKVSVSSLVQEKSSKSAPAGKRFLADRLSATARGILMHKLLEAMKYQGLEGSLEAAERFFTEDTDEIRSAMNWIHDLKTPHLQKILESGYVEWGFQYVEDGKVVDGQVDLWGKADGKVWIVDYKTGSSKYSEKAFLQMHYYAKALRLSGVKEEINLAVVFPFEKSVATRTVSI